MLNTDAFPVAAWRPADAAVTAWETRRQQAAGHPPAQLFDDRFPRHPEKTTSTTSFEWRK
ncbi:hypothetical protein [Accumulibacter sp.]|uniref:hypothetical protein n=1 Tax=Accumulibacter sp. TaxID=2053492 RepID=UPI00260EC8BC|nr:hypothetical protein [Accumulibacter sp.]